MSRACSDALIEPLPPGRKQDRGIVVGMQEMLASSPKDANSLKHISYTKALIKFGILAASLS
jgi:hypothetical protein